jgi:hypothetical protein
MTKLTLYSVYDLARHSQRAAPMARRFRTNLDGGVYAELACEGWLWRGEIEWTLLHRVV